MIIALLLGWLILDASYSFLYDYDVLKNCEYWTRNIFFGSACLVGLVGLLISYYMFKAVKSINHFSKHGSLPTLASKRGLKIFVLIMIVVSVLATISYWTLDTIYEENGGESNHREIKQAATSLVGAILGSQYIICSGFLIGTIYLRKTAQVKSADTGHLAIRDAVMMLVLVLTLVLIYIYMIIVFDGNNDHRMWSTMSLDFLTFLITISYYRVILKFTCSFRLQTKVDKDGNIDIVGIETNGNEIFKFVLNKEQQETLLGIKVRDVDSDFDSQSEFSDNMTSLGENTPRRMDYDHFVPDFEGEPNGDNFAQASPRFVEPEKLADYNVVAPLSGKNQSTHGKFN